MKRRVSKEHRYTKFNTGDSNFKALEVQLRSHSSEKNITREQAVSLQIKSWGVFVTLFVTGPSCVYFLLRMIHIESRADRQRGAINPCDYQSGTQMVPLQMINSLPRTNLDMIDSNTHAARQKRGGGGVKITGIRNLTRVIINSQHGGGYTTDLTHEVCEVHL